jgi:hypothetical protein
MNGLKIIFPFVGLWFAFVRIMDVINSTADGMLTQETDVQHLYSWAKVWPSPLLLPTGIGL